MLKSSRVTQLFLRQSSAHGGLVRASLRRGFIDSSTTCKAPVRNPSFSTITSPIWNRCRASTTRPSPLFRTARNARHNGTKASVGEQASASQPLSLSERMRKMSKKYGWTVVGIYLGLSVLDFPFCFLAVRLFGTERIGHIEHVLIDGFWGLLESAIPSLKARRERIEAEAARVEAQSDPSTNTLTKHEDASIWTQLLIAYGVHKSLIFFRIPITLAITPKVVKTLRGWGWKIGNGAPKAV